jgi:hypothetical protein
MHTSAFSTPQPVFEAPCGQTDHLKTKCLVTI